MEIAADVPHVLCRRIILVILTFNVKPFPLFMATWMLCAVTYLTEDNESKFIVIFLDNAKGS